MKSIKLLSLLMALVLACCVMVGCGSSGDQDTDTTTASTAPTYAVTVSITVTDIKGNNIIEAANYSYQSSMAAPTAFTVLDDYCYMNMENGEGMVTTDADGRLVSVGDVVAVDGTSYWRITVNGMEISSVEFSSQELNTGDTVVITLNDSSSLS